MKKKLLSYFRKQYLIRFFARCAILVLTVVLFFAAPGQFEVLSGFACFRKFSLFSILWLFWMVDMVLALMPSAKYWPIGSQKFLKETFQPLKNYMERTDQGLVKFIVKSNRDTLRIGIVWLALLAAIGTVWYLGLLSRELLMVICVFFYVCDLICVLFWCPFRAWFMKNRCCTTCRIFNWDHMMRFSPLVFIPGFYTWTLCLASFVVFLVWEITFALHPERFWEGTNAALKCANCTDMLCGDRNCKVDHPADILREITEKLDQTQKRETE